MEFDSAKLDQIVREVVRRLQNVDSVDASVEEPAVLVVEDRVVTSALLRGRLQGVTRLRVRADAIVTPLVHDLLKDESVQLQRTHGATTKVATAKLSSVGYLLVDGENDSTAAFVAQLNREGHQWKVAADWNSLMRSLKQTAQGLAFVSSPRWAERLCSAGQQGVNAVVAADLKSVDEACGQTQVRLMIVNSRRHTEAEIVELARRFGHAANS
ncbi:MAG: hypothetical protein GY768_21135 [Planctomycetaceae bacterium]|nr:hypothetical protein [Planctomycetaceae bacterium]